MRNDNYITINNCSVCSTRMNCSKRFGNSFLSVSSDNLQNCYLPPMLEEKKELDWGAAEQLLWDKINLYSQHTPKGKLNLIYLCVLLTRCLKKQERTEKLYQEIISYQERGNQDEQNTLD